MPYEPQPDDHFTFGLWTVGNRGRDPFGNETRPPLDPVDAVHHLAELGAYGVSFHDDDLVPPGLDGGRARADPEAVPARARRDRHEGADGDDEPVLESGVQGRRVHRQRSRGAAVGDHQDARRDRHGRRARRDGLRDVGRARGHRVATRPRTSALALDRYKEAVDICCAYVRDRGYDVRFALEPKPNEPRGNILLPTVGHALAFVDAARVARDGRPQPRVRARDDVGAVVPPRGRADAVAGKLFHIDLNAQVIGKYDQDFRFGSEGIRDAFYLVKLLEDAQWPGMRHFDAHAYRTETADGVWDFARGCMRTYLILREKAQRFHADAEIQAALDDRDGRPARRPRAHPTATPPTRSPRCAAARTTSTRWRRAATASNGSTSS